MPDQDNAGIDDLDAKPYKETRAEFDKKYFTALLKQTKGNVTEAIKISGLGNSVLYEKLKQCGVDPKTFRSK